MSQPPGNSNDETKPFVELFRAGSLFEADDLACELQEADIPTRVENELLQGGLGELPPGWSTLPKVMVPEPCLADARAILERLKVTVSERGSKDDCCLACNEPMLDEDTCKSCGWSWNDNSEPDPDEHPQVEIPSPSRGNPSSPESRNPESGEESAIDETPTNRTARELWIELSVVMAVSVIPPFEAALQPSFEPYVPSYASQAIGLLVISVCSAWIVAYIIDSNGESLAEFGIVWPQLGDVFVGILIVPLIHLMWVVYYNFIPMSVDITPEYEFAAPSSNLDYALMVVAQFANAFHEELVLRAYLITRLSTLLKLRRRAVLLAAAVFASYHIYQGPVSTGGIFLFGVSYGVMWVMFRRLWPLVIGHALGNIAIDLFDWY